MPRIGAHGIAQPRYGGGMGRMRRPRRRGERVGRARRRCGRHDRRQRTGRRSERRRGHVRRWHVVWRPTPEEHIRRQEHRRRNGRRCCCCCCCCSSSRGRLAERCGGSRWRPRRRGRRAGGPRRRGDGLGHRRIRLEGVRGREETKRTEMRIDIGTSRVTERRRRREHRSGGWRGLCRGRDGVGGRV